MQLNRIQSILIFLLLLLLTVFASALIITNGHLVSNDRRENITDVSSSILFETDDGCIVQVNGNKYNVTDLTSSHWGGNLFECGTDMTLEFNSQHGYDYGRLEKYKI